MKVLVVLCAVMAVSLAAPGYLGGLAGGLAAPGLLAGGLAAPGLLAGGLAGYGVLAPAVGLIPGGPANIVIGPGGIPLDTPAVAAAKGAHAVAVAETRARDAAVNAAEAATASVAANAALVAGAGLAGPGVIAARGLLGAGLVAGPAAIAAPVAVAAPSLGYAAYGPANIVIGPGGVPLDTPEVAAGKVANAVAHLEAKARNGVYHG